MSKLPKMARGEYAAFWNNVDRILRDEVTPAIEGAEFCEAGFGFAQVRVDLLGGDLILGTMDGMEDDDSIPWACGWEVDGDYRCHAEFESHHEMIAYAKGIVAAAKHVASQRGE